MEWLAANWLILIPIIIAGASVIVKITPNETDNKILAGFIKFFQLIGLNTEPVKPKDK